MRARALGYVLAAALVALTCAAPGLAHAATPSSADLVEDPTAWDGQTIEFTGEAIGEAMSRGDEVWLHLNDDAYARGTIEEGGPLSGYNSGHAVVVPPQMAERVTVFGDHKHRGDLVRVTGVFSAACSEHGGDMDIHASALAVVERGHDVTDPVATGKLWALAITTGLALLTAGAYLARRRPY
ncbi:MAG: hypothetical protein QMC79_03410 [Anaerosomatales bacterium]|nr:hypothetical protein [Anaerosomatales bacterium]